MTGIDAGAVALVAELRGHERQAEQSVKPRSVPHPALGASRRGLRRARSSPGSLGYPLEP